jgi:hypothetical protein
MTLALASVAQAQWLAVGRWGTERHFRFIAPGTWMVLQQDGWVEISAEAENHDGRLTFRCNAETPGGQMEFSGYFGDGLDRPTDPASLDLPVTFVIDTQRFDQTVTYAAADRLWRASGPLNADMLDALSWGSRMVLQTEAGTPVAEFRLNNSGGARAALRRTCGL